MSGLYGLVVCGGKSTRMGRDKSLLNYHGKPQRYHLYELLQSVCDRVFISCNSSQMPDIPSEYEVLVDAHEFENIGPMGALRTAARRYQGRSLMLVGCDYPYVNIGMLHELSKAILKSKDGAAYYNIAFKKYEPLLSGFQSNALTKLNNNYNLNYYSLQSFLNDINANAIVPENSISISSIDTPDEYEKTIKQLYSSNNDNIF